MRFIRWVGSKEDVIPLFKDYFPNFNNVRGYIEPFLGSGSVFFYLKENGYLEGKQIYLSDINRELINCFRVVRDNLEQLIPLLDNHQREHGNSKNGGEDYYYKIRHKFNNSDIGNIETAAMFLYLDYSAFGSDWRVNSSGDMNVPFRKNKDVNFDYDRLKRCSFLLKGSIINNISFEKVFDNILKINEKNMINGGSLRDYFVYFDPPYDTVNFQSYTKNSWNVNESSWLRKVFKMLNDSGCKVMMSNSDSVPIHRDFGNGKYNVTTIETNRVGNTLYAGDKRDNERISEVIVTNYKLPVRQLDIVNAWC